MRDGDGRRASEVGGEREEKAREIDGKRKGGARERGEYVGKMSSGG